MKISQISNGYSKPYLNQRKNNVNFESGKAIYAGSFDPITKGHLDLIKDASKLFDSITVLVAKNSKKQGFLPVETRTKLIQECVENMKNVTVDFYEGLTVNYAKEHNAQYLLRGMRSVSDFDNEMQISKINEELNPGLKTVFLFSSSENSAISSSIVRELLANGSDAFARFVPKPVANYLSEMYKDTLK